MSENPGKLNRKIDIQQNTPAKDSTGQSIESWAGVTGKTSLWASVITTGGREFYAAQRLNVETSAVFKLRYKSGVTSLMRVKYSGRNFEIINVNDKDEKHEWLLLSCKEVV